MTEHERQILEMVAEELRYQSSARAARDRRADRERRAAADRAAGHLPECTLSRCVDDCPSLISAVRRPRKPVSKIILRSTTRKVTGAERRRRHGR